MSDFLWGMAAGVWLVWIAGWLRALALRWWHRNDRPRRTFVQTTFSGNPIPGSDEWDEKNYGFDRSPWSRYLPIQRQGPSGLQ